MLNRKKTKETVVVDNKRNRYFASPPPLPEIDRVTSLKILGVTMIEGLLASNHVYDVITRCARTLRIASLVHPRHGRSGLAHRLSVSCRRQSDVRIECMVGIVARVVSLTQSTDNEWMHSSVAAYEGVTAHRTCLH